MINKNHIDIILPNFNKKNFISETINSVLNQGYKNWKLILIDNNSTDGSKEMIKNYQNHEKIEIYYLKKNKGVAFSRNFALRKSKGEYIAFLDSDDLWEKNKLEKQLRIMQENNYNFTYTDYTPFYFKNDKRFLKKTIIPKTKYDLNSFIKDTSIATSSMMIKRKSISFNNFNSKSFNEDYDFKCKILKSSLTAYKVSENLTYYRITPNSRSSFKIKSLFSIFNTNKNLLKLNFFNNIKSIIFISLNSLRKYGFK